jgi:hypothetical protein
VENGVDFYAVSFVKDANVIHELKDYLKSNVSFIYGSPENLYWELSQYLIFCFNIQVLMRIYMSFQKLRVLIQFQTCSQLLLLQMG